MSAKLLAQRYNSISLTGFKLTRLEISRFFRRIYRSVMMPTHDVYCTDVNNLTTHEQYKNVKRKTKLNFDIQKKT
jgi:hypothetical protein